MRLILLLLLLPLSAWAEPEYTLKSAFEAASQVSGQGAASSSDDAADGSDSSSTANSGANSGVGGGGETDALDFDLEELGVADDAEQRLLRGNFYYTYLTGDYYRTLYYLNAWQTLIGAEGAPELEADVMRAAVYLSLGLEDEAESIFYDVFQRGGMASGDAWYFLAQRLFSSGEYERAEQSARNALSAVPAVSGPHDQELRAILVGSISEQDRVDEARDAMSGLRDKSIWAGYARYNLILAMIRQNYKSRVLEATVDEAIYYLPDTDEGVALRDRILLISGIAAMEREKHAMANRYFRDVTLESVFSPPALLHYGWNLLAEWRYEDAIQPWRILQRMYDEYHPAVVESYLAVPHTLELIDAVNQAVLAYERIEDSLSVMVDELKTVNQQASLGEWLGEWRNDNATENWGWQRQALSDLPDSQVTRFAQGLLDDEVFVIELAVLHDLDRIQADLTRAARDMALWEQVLVERREHLASLGGEAVLDALEDKQMDVLRRILSVQDRLLDEDEKVFAYASSADEARIERLRSVVPAVTYLQKVATPTRELWPYKERWRRMRGLQLWEIYEHQPQRKWDTERDHMILRSETDQLFKQLENTRTSLMWADSTWRGFPEQVTAIRGRIVEAQARVAELQTAQEAHLTTLAETHLTELDERLTLYLAQARLALARLYDDSLQKNFGDDDYDGEPETPAAKPAPKKTEKPESGPESEQESEQELGNTTESAASLDSDAAVSSEVGE